MATNCAVVACAWVCLVLAVEVGDAALLAVAPEDLGGDVLAAGTQAPGAQLADGQ